MYMSKIYCICKSGLVKEGKVKVVNGRFSLKPGLMKEELVPSQG